MRLDWDTIYKNLKAKLGRKPTNKEVIKKMNENINLNLLVTESPESNIKK